MDLYSTLTNELRAACPSLELREWEPMCAHTTFRIGGPARLMALPKSEEEAVSAVRAAGRLGVAPFFMGNGSDLLVSDQGYDGLIIKAFDGLGTLEEEGGVITAGSGVPLARLAGFAAGLGLSGLEFAHGIPGTVGGALTMNAGAYTGEMRQVAVETVVLNARGERERVVGADQGFSYRHSAFSDGRRLILRARFALKRGDREAIEAEMRALMEKRRGKQPLEYPSAGSTFKRPKGCFAAALIEECGLKGLRIGGAQVSEKHAGFVVNRGGATCADVLAVVDRVRETVLRERGVALELEIKTL